MFNLQEINIDNIIVHFIGNKTEEEGTSVSDEELEIDDEISDILKQYFLNPFKPEEYFHLDLEGPVFEHVSSIFKDSDSFIDSSKEIAEYLYQQSEHPKIKPGELYIVKFSNCVLDGEIVNAIGLFKSESKDTFLKVVTKAGHFEVIPETGTNVGKLDKGCLIFDSEGDKGYMVSVVDSSGKGTDAQFWRNYFLKLKTRQDDYFQTKNYLDLCKSFVVEQAPKEFEVSKADQVDFLNKSANFFKTNQEFELESFTQEVIPQPDIAESFKEYKKQYETEKDMKLEEEFSISLPAVKKQAKVLKNVIKLDKNFHIYVHGNREYIVKGFDEQTGMHFYQLFYKEEE
jgi:hypothetical protein